MNGSMQICRRDAAYRLAAVLSVDPTFFNELECNLALPSNTEVKQDEDAMLPQIGREVCAHLREDILPAGKDP
jgi:hypothetical protein